jgi:hypothetical protein
VFVARARLPIQELWQKKINGILAREDVTPIILIEMVKRKEMKEKVIEKVRSTQGSSMTKATLKRDGKIQCYKCGGFGHMRINYISKKVMTQPSNLGIRQPNPRTSSNGSGITNSQGQPRANTPPTRGWKRGSGGWGRGDGKRRGVGRQSQVNVIEVTTMGDQSRVKLVSLANSQSAMFPMRMGNEELWGIYDTAAEISLVGKEI